MSAPVDSLSIKVDASARGANQQLDKLVQKLIQLRSSVNGIKVGNLNTMAASIQNFSKAANGLSQVKTSDFTRMAKSIEKLSSMKKLDLTVAAFSINRMSKALKNFSNVNLGDNSKKISSFARAIGNLDGQKIGEATTKLPGLSKTLRNVINDMSKLPDVSPNILSMVRALGSFKGVDIGNAATNLPRLTSALKSMMMELSKAPTVSNNIIAMTNAMANLGAQASGIRSIGNVMNSSGSSGNRFFGMVKNVTSGIKNFYTNVRSASANNRSFASTLGLLYAKFWALKSAMDWFGKSVTSSMDYIEEYNYFNTTMEKIASEWSKDYKKYGYQNADAYGKSFQNRITEMMGKMTGFNMNQDGTLTDLGNKNLGLDVTQMTNYAAGVAQVTNSVGLCGEASTVTSKALSMLAGDMSSFRNLDMSTVMNNFSSGIIGQSRALYKYGIDITNATLATYAHEMGIKKDIATMTQGEKMQLRMIAILDQSRVAWGDLAKTINSPSNQMRLLQNNFKALSRTIGNMFLPIVAKVLPYVNGLVIAIRRLFEWTASMLGIDLKEVIGNSGGGYSDAFDGLEEDANNASDAVDNTTDSVKKLAKQLMGFDELNVINTNDSQKSKGDGSQGSGAPIDLTDQLSAALADYEKVWNQAYKDMTNDAEKFADKLTKLFKDAWTSGDGSDIGSSIAKWLNKGLKWVNDKWDVVDEQVQKIANILATAVNGFTYEFDWSGLGTALSNTLQTWLDGETTFFEKTDWTALGNGLATSINTFIGDGKDGPIQSFFTSIGSKLRAAIELAFGAVTTFKFDNLGKALGQGINDAFSNMDKKIDGKNGWERLGITISKSITGIADTMIVALKTIRWENVGEAITELIGNIKFKKIGIKFSNLTGEISNAISRAIKGVSWVEVGQKIGDFLVGVDWSGVAWDFTKMAAAIVSAIGKAIAGVISKAPIESAIVGLFAVLKWTKIGKGMFSSLATAVTSKIALAISGGSATTISNAIVGLLARGVPKLAVVANPYTALAAGIVATIVYTMKSVENYKFDIPAPNYGKAEKAFNNLKKSISDVKSHIKSTQNAINSLDTSKMNAELQGVELQTLADEYYNLSQKAKLSTNEQKRLKELYSKLKQEIPELKKHIDKQTKAYTGTKDELQKLIDKTKTYYKVQAAQEDLVTIAKEQYKNEKALVKAENELRSARDKQRTQTQKYNKALKELVKEGFFAYDKATKTYVRTTKIANDEDNKRIKQMQKYGVNAEDMGKSIGKAEKKVNALKSANQKLDNEFKNAKKYIDDNTKALKKNSLSIKEIQNRAKKGVILTYSSKTDAKYEKQIKSFSSLTDKLIKVTADAKETGNYKEVKKVYSSWEKNAKKTLTAYLNGELDEKSIGELRSAWDSFSGNQKKELLATLTGKEKNNFLKLAESWNKLENAGNKNETANFSAKGTLGNIEKEIEKLEKTKIKLKTKGDTEGMKNIDKKIAKLEKQKITLKAEIKMSEKVKASWKKLLNSPNANKIYDSGALKAMRQSIATLATGGIYKGGKWHSITKFAGGGFPGMGQMFIARESGPELVGMMGSHPAVVNNDQIVASVSDGVFNALAPVLTQVANTINALNSKMDNMGSNGVGVEKYKEGDLLKVVRKEDSNYRKRTGKSAFEY